MSKKKNKTAKKKTKLSDFVAAAKATGADVRFSLKEQPRMPQHLPGDHAHVSLLLGESERVSAIGNHWLVAQVPNQIAAEAALRNGWAFALAGAWLRCRLAGEVGPEAVAKGKL